MKKKKKTGKDVEKVEHLYIAGKMAESLWKKVWQFLKKLNTEVPYDLRFTPTDIYA